jgi:hypothetical protein
MSSESLDDRITRAEHLVARCDEVSKRHRLDAQAEDRKGNAEKAASFIAKAERQECLMRGHAATAERLRGQQQGMVGRAVYADALKVKASLEKEARPRPDPLAVYTEAMMHIAELRGEVEDLRTKAAAYDRKGDARKRDLALGRALKHEGYIPGWQRAAEDEIASSGRDLPREYQIARKAKHRQSEKEAERVKRLEKLAVNADPRTAAGQRQYVMPAPKKSTVANLAGYRDKITLVNERTKPRIEAMYEFDMLCGKAEAGLFPEINMDADRIGGSGPGPDIVLSRVAGLEEFREIEDVIGAQNVKMLRAWIFEGHTMIQLSRLGYGSERTAMRLCLAALDSLVTYWRTMNALAARRKGEDTAGRVSA